MFNNHRVTGKSAPYFEGWYLKHQNGKETVALIPGIQIGSDGERSAFIQVITDQHSYYVKYPFSAFQMCRKTFCVRIGQNIFSRRGIRILIDTPEFNLHGIIQYGSFAPLAYPVMGPFAMLPGMECNHGVLSMDHSIRGKLTLNGRTVDFSHGKGYIEKDWGRSFPKRYFWSQCNDFTGGDCSVMASAAEIPFSHMSFEGCICVIRFYGKEYRIATYLGAKVLRCTEKTLLIKQGKLLFQIDACSHSPQKLKAPVGGDMARTIHEHAACRVRYRLAKGGVLLFDSISRRASYEYVDHREEEEVLWQGKAII